MTKQNDKLETIKTDANQPKSELMRLQSKLIELGFTKKANQLEKIIGNLENWQNRA